MQKAANMASPWAATGSFATTDESAHLKSERAVHASTLSCEKVASKHADNTLQ